MYDKIRNYKPNLIHDHVIYILSITTIILYNYIENFLSNKFIVKHNYVIIVYNSESIVILNNEQKYRFHYSIYIYIYLLMF